MRKNLFQRVSTMPLSDLWFVVHSLAPSLSYIVMCGWVGIQSKTSWLYQEKSYTNFQGFPGKFRYVHFKLSFCRYDFHISFLLIKSCSWLFMFFFFKWCLLSASQIARSCTNYNITLLFVAWLLNSCITKFVIFTYMKIYAFLWCESKVKHNKKLMKNLSKKKKASIDTFFKARVSSFGRCWEVLKVSKMVNIRHF